MRKVGRNTPCPCGSGKKSKHCCGKLYLGNPQLMGPTPQSIHQIRLQLARREAREHQRRLMQGLGQPIISFEDHGYRIVAIGKQLRWSKGWRTFPDFLFDYIKLVLTPEMSADVVSRVMTRRHCHGCSRTLLRCLTPPSLHHAIFLSHGCASLSIADLSLSSFRKLRPLRQMARCQ